MSLARSRLLLVASLWSLAALYACAYHQDQHRLAAWAVFALPPLLLGLACLRRGRAPFWSAVLALFWFSHGVMAAWTQPAQRPLHLAETLLALLVIAAASAPGLRARWAARSARR